jgi:hypothetical protein
MIRGFDLETFQDRINERVGLSKDGKPIIRLSYAPLVRSPIDPEVPRYWSRRWNEGGVWKYEQPDRWVFEKRLEKESYWEACEATRYQYSEALNKWVDLGPPPQDYYVFDSDICVHSSFFTEKKEPECCTKAWEGDYRYDLNHRKELVKIPVGGRSRCWGLPGLEGYREPGEADMVKVERAAQGMKHGKYFNPYAPLSTEQLTAIEASANVHTQKMIDETKEVEKEVSRDFEAVYGWRLFESNLKRLRHGRYFFPAQNGATRQQLNPKFLGSTWKVAKNGLALPS